MALTRKFLVALGIEEEKIDEIITAHTDVTNALKKERDDYKESAEKLADVQKELDSANKKLKEYENSDESDSWKTKYEDMEKAKKKIQQDFDDYKQQISDAETLSKKKDAYKQLLKDVGISEKRLNSIVKVSDFSSIELDDEGKIKDADTLKDTVKNEWSEFITTEHETGAGTPNPPQGKGGGGGGVSKASELAQKFYTNRYGAQKKED